MMEKHATTAFEEESVCLCEYVGHNTIIISSETNTNMHLYSDSMCQSLGRASSPKPLLQ